MWVSRKRVRLSAFTLVELLVVLAIIAVLISLLLPALSTARQSAASVKSLSNLRAIGQGLVLYKGDNKGIYPVHSSPSSQKPRTRWADQIFQYMRSPEIYSSPLINEGDKYRMNKPFAHTCDPVTGAVTDKTIFWGGYGYNYQYLGNNRNPGGIEPYLVKDKLIPRPSETIAVADTDGSRNGGPFFTAEGVYVVDPPLMSMTLGSRGSRKSSPTPGAGQYGYSGGTDGDPAHRATPAARNRGKVNVVFCDGHAEAMDLKKMDDFNGDGVKDNGWWNGRADHTVR